MQSYTLFIRKRNKSLKFSYYNIKKFSHTIRVTNQNVREKHFPFTTSQLSSFNFHLLASADPSLCPRYTSASSPIKNYRIIGGRAEDHRRYIGVVLANNSSKKAVCWEISSNWRYIRDRGDFLFTDISRLVGFLKHFSEKVEKNPFIICSFDRKYLPLQSINNPFIIKTKFKIAKWRQIFLLFYFCC